MNEFYIQKIKINKGQNLLRLDQALSKRLDNLTRSQIKILIKNNNVKMDQKNILEASDKVKEGEIYTVYIPKIKKTTYSPENIKINVVYEDDDIIVINKNAGMVTHPAPGNQEGTLVQALLNHTNNNLSNINISRPGIVHRLDKDTSGLIVVAKNDLAHNNIADQFKIHSISRKYKAIVWGTPQNQNITGYINRNKINRKKMSLNQNKDGKFSKTILKLIKNFGICSIVECELETGRTHQVRVHLTSINSPIIGDKLYGKNKINNFSKNKEMFNKFLILKNFQRQALHAYYLDFIHPINKKHLKFECDLPEDMRNLLDIIAKY